MLNVKEKHEGCITLNNENADEVYAARFDGCVHIEHYFNGSSSIEDRDYLHICDLHGFIETLQEVERKAKEHFGKDWPL